jgi:hypothetical protein
MNTISLEDWFHSSDEERAEILSSWDTTNGDGSEIVAEVANLFKDECVYNVKEINIVNKNGLWVIEAFMKPEDYANVRHRQNMEFLGFKIAFNSVDNKPV